MQNKELNFEESFKFMRSLIHKKNIFLVLIISLLVNNFLAAKANCHGPFTLAPGQCVEIRFKGPLCADYNVISNRNVFGRIKKRFRKSARVQLFGPDPNNPNQMITYINQHIPRGVERVKFNEGAPIPSGNPPFIPLRFNVTDDEPRVNLRLCQ